MGYYIDLRSISIDNYKEVLKSAYLIPSRMILKENTDDNLNKLKEHSFENLEELQKALKNKKKLPELSRQFDIPVRFLEVLRAEINGYLQKPNKIKDFPDIDDEVAGKLERIGIKDSLKLYGEVLTPQKRNDLSNKSGVSRKNIQKLTRLSDLSRIRWVNHTFAYVLFEAGFDTAKKVAEADCIHLYETIKKLNEERRIYNAHIGLNDMKLCVDFAKNLDFEIDY